MREAAPVDVTNGLAGEDVLLPATPVGGALIVTVLQYNFRLQITLNTIILKIILISPTYTREMLVLE